MNYGAIKYWIKRVYEILTCLNKNSAIVFSDYNRQLCKVIRKASINNRIYFLPERCSTFDYRNVDNLECFNNHVVNWYKDYFKKKNCNYFVINTVPRGDLDRHAALVAASELNSVKVVALDHGDTGFDDPSGIWHWLYYSNYFYVCNTEARKYIERQGIYEPVMAIREWKRPLPIRKKAERYVLFAPGFYNGELFIGQLTDTAKYRHIEVIVRYLNQLGMDYGYRVIYKTMKGSDESFNPRSIDKFAEYEAVEYVDSGSFDRLLSKAAAFVTDCVSTPFYDAVDIGVPSLCLYNSDGSPLRETVLKMFGDSIKVCKDEYAVGHGINNFFAGSFNFGYRPNIEHNVDPMPWEE